MVVDFGAERDANFERCQREPTRITMNRLTLAHGESSFFWRRRKCRSMA
jgi:hypothetical protein